MAATFDSQALPWTIEILEGDLRFQVLQPGNAPGIIKLVGRALPFRGVKIKGKQRVKTTFYPGNPVGTQQFMGPTEEPTTITGVWRDRYLGDGAARELMALFDRVRRRGPSLRVTWGGSIAADAAGTTASGTAITRVGAISEVEFEMGKDAGGINDIGWSVTFDWRSQGESAAPIVAATGVLSAKDGFAQVTDDLRLGGALWQAFVQGPVVATVGLPQSVLDGMTAALEQTERAAVTMDAVSASIAAATVVPTQAFGQILGACAAAVAGAQTAVSNVLGARVLLLEVRDSALDLLRIKDQVFTILAQLDQAMGAATDASAAMAEQGDPDVVAEVRAPAGTDLRDVAFQFYGDPDLWFLIANANNLESSAVPSPPGGPSDDPNLPLVIPRLQPGTVSDLRQQC